MAAARASGDKPDGAHSGRPAIRTLIALALTLLGASALANADQAPCGVDAPCPVESGDYRLALPEGWEAAEGLPAMVFFHGYASSAAPVVEGGLAERVTAAGYILIVPNGARLPGRDVRGWPARTAPEGARDDVAFVRRVVEDAARRLPLDRGRVLVSGFSSGGSMAWYVACLDGGRYAGFAPVAGGLRRPLPVETCPGGPVRLLHFHGFADLVVPLEGRPIGDWHQGDVFLGLHRLRAINGCPSKPARIEDEGVFACRVWAGCGSGRDLRFCLHDGGHVLPEGWAGLALDWFEGGAGGE